MDSQKQQAAERIKQANNILVTVSSNPSVDQLAACIGLTLTLNKMGKHATAVYSGATPSTIEFLQPEKTLEKNTDSLRDFIIALDKSKADKLRYKVEDRVVKIFITPYKTSINEKDLEFSQGDFNVDVVLALGVHNQADLDQAITSHGRILHDATVVTMNVKPGGELGSINWLDPNASSLSELATQLIELLDKKLIDTQIATALLTGIVAETERFSNAKTSPQTMSISAELMAGGANQQLVATKLEEPAPPPPPAPIAQESKESVQDEPKEEKKPDDGTLEISHDEKLTAQEATEPAQKEKELKTEQPQEEKKEEAVPEENSEPETAQKQEEPKAEAELEPEKSAPEAVSVPPEEKPEQIAPQIHIDEGGALSPLEDTLPPKAPSEPPTIIRHSEPPKMVLEPPTLGGQLTASATPGFGEAAETGTLPNHDVTPSTPPMGQTIMPPSPGSPDYEEPAGGAAPADSFLVGSGNPTAPTGSIGADRTLSDIEQDVHSPHADTSVDMAPSDTMLPPLPETGSSAQAPQTSNPITFDINSFSAPGSGTSDNQSNPLPNDSALTPNDNPAANPSTPDVSSARDAVEQAIGASPSSNLDPIEALNAQTVNLPLGNTAPAVVPADQNPQNNPTLHLVEPEQGQATTDPNAPPPVPPPMMPPTNPY
ncbi:MAG TPA: hypothetical protein VFT16_05105 [Candidatus Saccharimonadales bacterium]|nr:hypothetical protein [Candidatus Saccharimonadales bacterium]